LLAVTQFGNQPILDVAEMHGLNQVLGGLNQRVGEAWTKQREASARNPAAGQVDIVDHRQARKQRGNLIGAAQAAADALIRRKGGDVLAEEADSARGRQKI